MPAQIYYFYRYDEAPQHPSNGNASLKSAMHGGHLMVPLKQAGKAVDVPNDGSERQLMFSNHSNVGDGQDICAESFLFTAKVGARRGGVEGLALRQRGA